MRGHQTKTPNVIDSEIDSSQESRRKTTRMTQTDIYYECKITEEQRNSLKGNNHTRRDEEDQDILGGKKY